MNLSFPAMGHNSGHYVHTVVEALRLSFADAATYCADPSMANVPISGMLDKNYATERRGLIKPDRYEKMKKKKILRSLSTLLIL